MFDDLILLFLPLYSNETTSTLQPELTAYEKNALRYAAGYVVHAIKEKIKKGKDPMREAILYGLSDMIQSDDVCDLSKTWLNAIDRGGLIRINHTTFKMFHAIEMELRQHLTIANIQDMDQTFKNGVISSIIADVDVQYYIECATEDLDEDERKNFFYG